MSECPPPARGGEGASGTPPPATTPPATSPRHVPSRPEDAVPMLRPCDLPVVWSWEAAFGRRAPVEIEVGCGRGGFLVEAARRAPDRDFVGIDYAGKFLARTRRKAARAALRNVLLYYGTVEQFLPQVPTASVAAIHVYFPDPWHKDRHAKRRGVRPELLQWFVEVLEPGGSLHLRTDVATYFDEMQDVVARFAPALVVERVLDYHGAPPDPDWIMTDWEQRFLGEGLTCRALTARRA